MSNNTDDLSLTGPKGEGKSFVEPVAFNDDDYHTVFRDYEYDLHKAYDDEGMARIEASFCRQLGTSDMLSNQVCRACVRQLSNGRWGVYIRFITKGV